MPFKFQLYVGLDLVDSIRKFAHVHTDFPCGGAYTLLSLLSLLELVEHLTVLNSRRIWSDGADSTVPEERVERCKGLNGHLQRVCIEPTVLSPTIKEVR